MDSTRFKMINFFAFCFTLLLREAYCEYSCGTVYMNEGVPTFKPGVIDKSGLAYGFFNDTIESTGWGVLEIKTSPFLGPDEYSMFAAGYLEGALTSKRIWQHYTNLAQWFFEKYPKLENSSKAFFEEQERWSRPMAEKHYNDSQFWRHARYILSQYDGLIAGYKETAEKPLTPYAFQLLNGAGDLLDLRLVQEPSLRPDPVRMSTAQLKDWVHKNSMCSALIKVLPGFEDLYMSHSSWFVYQATLRIFKHYNFDVKNLGTAAKRISFSSYPGFLESLDDFYLMDSKLVMLQTTNNVFNMQLYEKVTPHAMLSWQRVRIANMMAHSGREWAEALSQYNSGTYNNQYMIIDLRKVHVRRHIDDDALWVIEQIPGHVAAADASAVLRTGYWPSYNVPFFESVYNLSGYPDVVSQHGTGFSYQLAPRAEIFRRDQAAVETFEDMKKLMRYNDYTEDKYSAGDSCASICCRGDLRASEPSLSGCYDTKVTSLSDALALRAVAINGPTRSHGLPPFAWTKQDNTSHLGLPNVYDFDFVQMQPQL